MGWTTRCNSWARLSGRSSPGFFDSCYPGQCMAHVILNLADHRELTVSLVDVDYLVLPISSTPSSTVLRNLPRDSSSLSIYRTRVEAAPGIQRNVHSWNTCPLAIVRRVLLMFLGGYRRTRNTATLEPASRPRRCIWIPIVFFFSGRVCCADHPGEG